MTQRKICLLGSYAVGKTSLISRYVNEIFSDKYLTTVGVKIDKKSVTMKDITLDLIIWDLAGEDDFCRLRESYLRGAAGYILVIDPTRPKTVEIALSMHKKAMAVLGEAPALIALNKSDIEADWQLDADHFRQLNDLRLAEFRTSAKTGNGVEQMFLQLAGLLISSES